MAPSHRHHDVTTHNKEREKDFSQEGQSKLVDEVSYIERGETIADGRKTVEHPDGSTTPLSQNFLSKVRQKIIFL